MGNLQYLQQRASLIQEVRRFFVDHGFLEVDTPIRQPALIPEAYIEVEDSGNWYLQTSPELCMKRLLAAGCGKIFQICKCFRKNERSARHLPEFTMLEWYRTDCDYHALMDDCVALLRRVADSLPWVEAEWVQSFARPCQYLTVAEAFRRYASISLDKALATDRFDELLCCDVEPHLGRDSPTFLHDYPAPLGSLARLKRGDAAVAERFELYVRGVEMANGFSELTDSKEQRLRFSMETEKIGAQGRIPPELPVRFLEDLSGIGEAAGIAFGMDRLVMLLCGASSIDEVVSFTPEEL